MDGKPQGKKMIRRNDSQYSKFWMGGEEFDFDPRKDFDAWDTDSLLRLAAFKRAVANFVRIVTGRDIPVLYNTGKQSYTEGSTVVLSAKLEHNQFDTAVGTALHEATHCVLTDFPLHRYMQLYQESIADCLYELAPLSTLENNLLSRCADSYREQTQKYVRQIMNTLDHELVLHIFERANKIYGGDRSMRYLVSSHVWNMSKLMENWVEDRRIDYFQFTTSPGYKGYYNAMYSSYFWSKLIGKAIRAKNYARKETWESYQFRIINLLHPDADLDALKGLREIWELVDLKHINRLKSTFDVWVLSYKILDVILKYVMKEEEKQDQKPGNNSPEKKTTKRQEEQYDDDVDENSPEPSDEDGNSDSTEVEKDNDTGDSNLDGGISGPSDSEDENDDDGEGDDGDSGSDSDDEEESDENSDGGAGDSGDEEGEDDESDANDLTPAQRKKMEKEEERQKSFLDGKTPKKSMSKTTSNAIKTLEESGVHLTSVGSGLVTSDGKPVKVQCVFIKKVTKELIESGVFPEMFSTYPYGKSYQSAIEEGVRLGTILGKKLQVRNEARVTKFNRLETGRIDKKLLASLGYNNDRVFYRTATDKYNKMIMHISVDASGSMSGKKWNDTLILLVSIIKAASMTSNLDVVVSMRGSTTGVNTHAPRGARRRRLNYARVRTTGGYSTSMRPLVAIVYDSRVDKFVKVTSLFKHIVPNGSTPEGLAFEPIIEDMTAGKSGEIDSLFVNISDGQPAFSTHVSEANGYYSFYYSGPEAGKHTASIVQRMRGMNIGILSYLITEKSEYTWRNDTEVFRTCYGKDAREVPVRNIVLLAKTLNDKFLEKNNN